MTTTVATTKVSRKAGLDKHNNNPHPAHENCAIRENKTNSERQPLHGSPTLQVRSTQATSTNKTRSTPPKKTIHIHDLSSRRLHTHTRRMTLSTASTTRLLELNDRPLSQRTRAAFRRIHDMLIKVHSNARSVERNETSESFLLIKELNGAHSIRGL